MLKFLYVPDGSGIFAIHVGVHVAVHRFLRQFFGIPVLPEGNKAFRSGSVVLRFQRSASGLIFDGGTQKGKIQRGEKDNGSGNNDNGRFALFLVLLFPLFQLEVCITRVFAAGGALCGLVTDDVAAVRTGLEGHYCCASFFLLSCSRFTRAA